MARRGDLVVAVSSFWTKIDGRSRLVTRGEVWAGDSDVVRADPTRFRPLTVHGSHGRIEAATAAPGERRGEVA